MTVMTAVVVLGGLGLILGLGLTFAYTKLAVTHSEIERNLIQILPGTNCGSCGYPGCEAFAAALAKSGKSAGFCPVGGEEIDKKISEILGVAPSEIEPMVVVLRCGGDKNKAKERFIYDGLMDCVAADLIQKGNKGCEYGCLGYGNCERVCPFDAIKMGDDGLPLIADDKCTGCGLCVKECPRDVLELIPKTQKVYVACNSRLKAPLVKKVCSAGCIACKLCEKNCPYGAIKVENNLARIDPAVCENATICILKCPTKCIVDKAASRPRAMIGTNCTGCEECKSVCPTDAITGEKGEQHKVDLSKCIGCALCYKKCECNAIIMAFSLGYSEKAVAV